MSQIHVEADEFADIVMLFLQESMREDMIKGNPRYDSFIDKLEKKGFKTILLNNYLKMDADTRVKYKRIKDVFDGGAKSIIYIEKEDKLKSKETDGIVKKTIKTLKKSIGLKEETQPQEFDRELCKRIFRKVKEVRFKTSMPITEERFNKIIDYCIKEKEEQNNG